MQTQFSPTQLQDPDIQASDKILRTCVHCGFCTATCPTYQLLGDELDSPRGRIYLMKEMLEKGAKPDAQVVKHIDRCLSCLACMTTCPSGVHYMHLVDHGRRYIEENYERPLADRAIRALIAAVIPNRTLFRWSVFAARLGRPFRFLMPSRLRAMLELTPSRLPAASATERPAVHGAQGTRRARVALLVGCVQPALKPEINEATIRLLNRLGVEVVVPHNACCGALVHHMGKAKSAHEQAARALRNWWRETEAGGGAGLDAIIINASGCGTTVKDYGWMFREDPDLAEQAAAVSALTVDITEFLEKFGIGEVVRRTGQTVAYHSACSMQHGQQIKTAPQKLLKKAGFKVKEVPEGHLCCGSAGAYNLLQPEIAGRLLDRKLGNLDKTGADLIATGNIGCITQIGRGSPRPVVHTVELLDYATGGPRPTAWPEPAGQDAG